MKNISYCLLAGLIFGSCSGKVYEQTDNGVIVKVQQKGGQDTRLVRFQVMGDKLIHVSATPESNLPIQRVWLLFLRKNRLRLLFHSREIQSLFQPKKSRLLF